MSDSKILAAVLICSILMCFISAENPFQNAADLAADAFKSRNVSGVLVFTCWGKDNIYLVRLLSRFEPSVSVAVVDPTENPKVLRRVLGKQGQLRSPTRMGVLADVACPGTLRLLHLASRLRHFSYLHFWVIVENGKLLENKTTDTVSSDELESIADVLFQPMGPEGKGQSPRMTKEIAIEVHPPPPRPPRVLTSNPELLHNIGHQTLSQLIMFVDSDVLWIQTDMLSDAYDVRPGTTLVLALEVFRSSMARELQVYQVAVASLTSQAEPRWMWTLSSHDRNDIVAARRDLEGALMRAMTIIQTPEEFTTIDDVGTKNVDIFPKVQFNLVKHMAEALNFSMAIYFDSSYGWQMPNGSFDGMIGQLKSYSIDLGAAGILMRHDRLTYHEICGELYQLRTAFIFRQPPRSSVDNIFLLPFTKKLWVSIGCLLALIIIFLVLQTGVFAPKRDPVSRSIGDIFITSMPLGEVPKTDDDNSDHLSVSDVFVFVLGALCQQGFPKMPDNISARVTIISLFFTSLFLFTSYSASIVAILQAPSHAVRSVSDVISSRMEVGLERQPYYEAWFREADNPLIRALYEKKIAPKGDKAYMTAKEGVRRLRNGFFAFQVEKNEGYEEISSTFLEDEKCDLSEFEVFNLPILAIPTPKRSPYRDIISQNLRWQREVGLLKREHLRWETHRPNCGGSGNTFVRVGLQEFNPALQALEYGIAFAIAMLFLETIYYNRSAASRVYKAIVERKQRCKKRGQKSVRRQ